MTACAIRARGSRIGSTTQTLASRATGHTVDYEGNRQRLPPDEHTMTVGFTLLPWFGASWGRKAWRWLKNFWSKTDVVEGVADAARRHSPPGPETPVSQEGLEPSPPESLASRGRTLFHIHDAYTGLIRVSIVDDHATFHVDNINDISIVTRAIQQARTRGATSGTWFTGDVVNDHIADQYNQFSQRGDTWLGGSVTRLPDGPEGDPQFRIDWETLPEITD
jgi:hypothetical protein